jgi:hypothetical protein
VVATEIVVRGGIVVRRARRGEKREKGEKEGEEREGINRCATIFYTAPSYQTVFPTFVNSCTSHSAPLLPRMFLLDGGVQIVWRPAAVLTGQIKNSRLHNSALIGACVALIRYRYHHSFIAESATPLSHPQLFHVRELDWTITRHQRTNSRLK